MCAGVLYIPCIDYQTTDENSDFASNVKRGDIRQEQKESEIKRERKMYKEKMVNGKEKD